MASSKSDVLGRKSFPSIPVDPQPSNDPVTLTEVGDLPPFLNSTLQTEPLEIGLVAGRYDLLDRIARGGMGTIYKARDRLLDRVVAVKVLRSRFLDRPELVRRFMDEAQISARLQHPGIVPVYEVGNLGDGRPFIAMKLIEGLTLAQLLRDRTSVKDDLGHFLKIFETLCQTISFAHTEGVVHRDLKPDNVMVGAFGEVQVMDWGLAKCLEGSQAFDPSSSWSGPGLENFDNVVRSYDITPPATPVITFAPLFSSPDFALDRQGSETTGQILGTITFMPPEQARGDLDNVDRRSDVFSMGAILCQILTGHPPYVGPTEEIKLMARDGELADAFERLDQSGADPALIRLAKECLSADPSQRPQDAEILAQRFEDYLDTIQKQKAAVDARRVASEVRVLQAEASAQLAQRSRQLLLAVSIGAICVAALLTTGLWWYRQDQVKRVVAEQQRRDLIVQNVNMALDEASTLQDEANKPANDFIAWQEGLGSAWAAWKRAEAISTGGSYADVSDRLVSVRKQLETSQRRFGLAQSLERIQPGIAHQDDFFSATETLNRNFESVFSKHGIQITNQTPEKIREEIDANPQAPRVWNGLLKWLAVATELPTREKLETILKQDTKHLQLRPEWLAALVQQDLPTLKEFASRIPTSQLSPSLVLGLTEQLRNDPNSEVLEALLVRTVRKFPHDYAVNLYLGHLLRKNNDTRTDALRYLNTAIALQPTSATAVMEMGYALRDSGRIQDAEDTFAIAARLDPKNPQPFFQWGQLQASQGKLPEALAHWKKASEVDPAFVPAHLQAGNYLLEQKDWKGAEKSFRTAMAFAPTNLQARFGLGNVFLNHGDAEDAIDYLRSCIESEPNNPLYRTRLGQALKRKGDPENALRQFRTASRLNPEFLEAKKELAKLYQEKGENESARNLLEDLAKTQPEDVQTQIDLGLVRAKLQDREGAIISLKKALSLDAKNPSTWLHLAEQQKAAGQLDEAQSSLQQASNLGSTLPEVLLQLATTALTQGDNTQAIPLLRRLVENHPNHVEGLYKLGSVLARTGQFREAAAILRKVENLAKPEELPPVSQRETSRAAIKMAALENWIPEIQQGTFRPSTATQWLEIAEVAKRLQKYPLAAEFYTEAVKLDTTNLTYGQAISGIMYALDERNGANLSLEDRNRFLTLASEWLRSELDRNAKIIRSDDPAKNESLAILRSWLNDRSLAATRNPAALAILTDGQRESWLSFWKEIDSLVQSPDKAP